MSSADTKRNHVRMREKLLITNHCESLLSEKNHRLSHRAIHASNVLLFCRRISRVRSRTGFARSRSSRCHYIYLCALVRRSCCLRHPYRVMPRGLYTDSIVVTSNTSRPPPAWRSSPCSPPTKLALPDSVATVARKLTVCILNNKTVVAIMVSNSLKSTQ